MIRRPMEPPAELQVEAHRDGESLVVTVAGEIDIASADTVAHALRDEAASHAAVLVLDLREVSFLDTSGLRLITEEVHRAREAGHRFAVVRGPDNVQRIFEIAGLADAGFWADSPEQALGRAE
jgi:anti-anti-sigma factor